MGMTLAKMQVNKAALGRIAALSLLVLAPCFWHSRIQAGDLSSHVYNAWLTGLLEQRPFPGLAIQCWELLAGRQAEKRNCNKQKG